MNFYGNAWFRVVTATLLSLGTKSLAEATGEGKGGEKAGICPCDVDVDGNTMHNLSDFLPVFVCATGGDCAPCAGDVCDVDCNGVVDLRDVSIVYDVIFLACPTPACCDTQVYGACCFLRDGIDGCSLANAHFCEEDQFPISNLSRTYHGDGTVCDANTCPAASTWGLLVLTLLLVSAATVLFGRRSSQPRSKAINT